MVCRGIRSSREARSSRETWIAEGPGIEEGPGVEGPGVVEGSGVEKPGIEGPGGEDSAVAAGSYPKIAIHGMPTLLPPDSPMLCAWHNTKEARNLPH